MTTEAEFDHERNILERMVFAARARLEHKLDELGRRVEDTKQALDVARLIRAHPLGAIGAGVVAGAAIALRNDRPRGQLATGVEAILTGVVLQAVRTWVLTRVGGAVVDRPPGASDTPPR